MGREVPYCPRCGKPVDQDWRFCTSCGYSVDVRCPNCDARVPTAAGYCPSCGYRLTVAPVTEPQPWLDRIGPGEPYRRGSNKQGSYILLILAILFIIGGFFTGFCMILGIILLVLWVILEVA